MLIDVTSLTSAEEYIRSQNRHQQPVDPFARQCFVEITQTLILMERAYVAHPVLPHPRAEDFGDKPRLLRKLVEVDCLKALQMDVPTWRRSQQSETLLLKELRTNGALTLIQFLNQAQVCDEQGTKSSLSHRIKQWSAFQDEMVHIPGSHEARITTSDGLEDDEFGEWVRSAAVAIDGLLEPLSGSIKGRLHLVGTIARGLKYASRADVMGQTYQSHPIRRDFSLTFEMGRQGVDSTLALQVIKVVRGINDSIGRASSQSESRMQLMQLELPLLGGRLWGSAEVGRLSDDAWVDLIVERIARYRADAAPLRHAIQDCITQEDSTRLIANLEQAGTAVLERLGLRKVEVSSVERDLMDGVASVTQAVTGIPKVNGLLIGSHSIIRKVAGRNQRLPYQQFLYKEFLRAYRASR